MRGFESIIVLAGANLLPACSEPVTEVADWNFNSAWFAMLRGEAAQAG